MGISQLDQPLWESCLIWAIEKHRILERNILSNEVKIKLNIIEISEIKR